MSLLEIARPISSRAFVVIGVAAFIGACVSSAPPPAPVPVPAAAHSTAPAWSPKPSPNGPTLRPLQSDLPNARSWLEPEVVNRLAVDCRWTPKELDGGESETRHPMSCRLAFVQSCAPDPCFEEMQDECKPKCTEGCHGCTGKCIASCESCKSGCTDDTCRHDCAQQCAKCRDSCIQQVDNCQTAVCGGVYDMCGKATEQNLKRPACRAACGAVRSCNSKCKDLNEDDPCVLACKKKFSGACMEKLFWYCMSVGHP